MESKSEKNLTKGKMNIKKKHEKTQKQKHLKDISIYNWDN